MLRAEDTARPLVVARVQDPGRRWSYEAVGTAKPLLMERATDEGLGSQAFHRATVDLPKRTHRIAACLARNLAARVTPPNRPTTPLPATSLNISRWFGANRPL